MWEYTQTDELRHYGVIGMKWGVRRGNASKAYTKAVRTKKKLMEKSVKAKYKSAVAAKRAQKRFFATDFSIARNRKKAASEALKSAKLERKAVKLDKAMQKVFKDYEITKLPAVTVNRGKKYVEQYELRKRET